MFSPCLRLHGSHAGMVERPTAERGRMTTTTETPQETFMRRWDDWASRNHGLPSAAMLARGYVVVPSPDELPFWKWEHQPKTEM